MWWVVALVTGALVVVAIVHLSSGLEAVDRAINQALDERDEPTE